MSTGIISPPKQREPIVGKPIDRVDGRLKVMGAARYAAEIPQDNIAHAVLIQSTIAKGRIIDIDTSEAEKAPGVLIVITHLNAPKLNSTTDESMVKGKLGEKLVPLQSDEVFYDGQHIGVVVAETLEQAKYAASLVRVSYEEEKPSIEIESESPKAYQPKQFFGSELQVQRGDVAKGFAEAEVKIEQTYTTPIEHHNPMESSASIAVWNGEQLTVYDATQWVIGTRNIVADALGIPEENVCIISHYVGGGFGCKGFTWWHTILAAVAARLVGRPVKLMVTRQQMFTSCGHRSRTIQQLAFGATRDGKLTAIKHVTTMQTAEVDEFIEPCGLTSIKFYAVPNLEVAHNLVRVNTGTPTAMRAPGEAPGMFALESGLDELAYELGIDPVELRIINHADVHPHTGKPWSSKYLKECYQLGAERFGWSHRNPKPRSMRDSDYLIGWGMASATYPGLRSPASAKAQLFADGRVIVSSATHDLGTGTYTIMTQIVADVLGLGVERIEFKLGESSMPVAPVAGGSQSAASVAPAVQGAAQELRSRVIRLAIDDELSPLYGVAQEAISTENGRVFLNNEPSRGETYAELLQRNNLPIVEVEAIANTAASESQQGTDNKVVRICVGKDENSDMQQYAFQSFGAHFVEVRVHPRLGQVRVTRFVSAIDVGRILNHKTARSQILGGITFGLGMALMEETVLDQQSGRFVVRNLADYHVPVQADVSDIDVLFIDKPDPHISKMGVRGVGEIGITGVAAAVANAIYHATGKRIRELPITPDKLL
ncbi:xanthine dehydrogenase family protein molybdopterin-binding subunit [Brasilonema octagenarum]|uniref:Xanthine dehydrogenase family protein molybdopterin-binding subunit n=1 Tax=Brasilonema octagenarum UFV-OR1 TaxID=417115 RepID=A0ABX1M4G4_9CYAN|nr:xanthine dehydrogenase family protein molybdopterin-binding subunit [Brasilonema octagenarum]NMF63425.1 xanthine dehydrogenase family protein molybdopterin-binding subunit [Brasilonema octagenarum UFV-OR1]